MKTADLASSLHSNSLAGPPPTVWIAPLLFLTGVALLVAAFYDGLQNMVVTWSKEEYSHGYMIPLVSLFLLAQKLPLVARYRSDGQWSGLLVVLAGYGLLLLGELSSLYVIIQYGFLVSLTGLVVAFVGFRGLRYSWVPLFYLVFMIPLPNFIYFNLSSELQLISSSIGVFILRLFDISVFLEGNIIDLGSYQLQVVEACSGLRYLFPLMSFGFLIAYLYKAPLWQKAIIFLSTIPITVFMNSFRIAVIGVTVDHWGIAAAEGFLHYFEGWVVFMACLGLLCLEIWLFHRLSRRPGNIIDSVQLDLPGADANKQTRASLAKFHAPFIGALLLTAAALPVSLMADGRQEQIPSRLQFTSLPLFKGGWMGREGRLETTIADTLKVSDYVIADYQHNDGGLPVNFYVAYYESQRKGASIHSPRSCIPGGGWRITSLEEYPLDTVPTAGGTPLTVNRVIIEKGDVRSLVYYWFQQRGRIITNEYLAKWYIFWDSLTLNRTDGALVRLTVQVPDTTDIREADQQMQKFLREFNPMLADYIPN